MGGVGVETIQSSERQDTPARENKPRMLTRELCWFQLATRGARPGERAAGEWLRVRQPRRAVPPDPGKGAHAQGRSTNSVTSSPALPAHVRISSVCAALPEDDRTVRALEPQDDASLRISTRQECDVILWRLDSILEPWNPPSTVAAHAAPASLQPPAQPLVPEANAWKPVLLYQVRSGCCCCRCCVVAPHARPSVAHSPHGLQRLRPYVLEPSPWEGRDTSGLLSRRGATHRNCFC